MTFSEMTLICENASIEFEMATRKIDAVVNHAIRACEIERSKAENRVITESATVDDLAMYYEEAEGKKKNVIIRAIITAKEKLIDFLKKIGEIINTKILHRDTTDTLKKLQKDPRLKKAKVEVSDLKGMMAADDKAMGKLKSLRAKAKSGKDVSREVDKVMDEHEREYSRARKTKKVVAGSVAATILLSVGAILAKRHKDHLNDTQRVKLDYAKVMNDAPEKEKNGEIPAGICRKIETAIDKTVRDDEDLATQYATTTRSLRAAINKGTDDAFKAASSKFGVDWDEVKTVKESAEDIYNDVLGDVFTESYDDYTEEDATLEDQAQAFFDAVASLR